MATGRNFDPLPVIELERLTSLLESAYQPIMVVLVDSDLMIGCLAKIGTGMGKLWDWVSTTRVDSATGNHM